jgi:hypothetical protein
MHTLNRVLVGGAAAFAMLAGSEAFANSYSDSLDNFRTAGRVDVGPGVGPTDVIYSYTWLDDNLPDDVVINITYLALGDTDIATNSSTLEMSNLAQLFDLTGDSYFLNYTVELFADAPTDNPDVRFGTTGIGANVQSTRPNVGTTKDIVGLATPIVPAPTYVAQLNTTPTQLGDTTFCGECRKFEITDTIDMTFNGGARGQVNSMSNDFETTVPLPGTVALLGFGLAGLGATMRRRRQA